MVYEAGPTGYGLARRALAEGIELDVCAPGKTERPPADRVKTDKREAVRLARLLAAGELVLVTIPSVEREQLRDLVRCREDIRVDLTRARHRIGKFLLRREIYWEGPGDVDAQAPLVADYLHAHDVLTARRDQVEADLANLAANGWDVLPSGVTALIVAIPVVAFISFRFVAVGAALSSHPLRTVSSIASPFLRLVGFLALIATIFVIVDGHTWQYYTGVNENIVRGVVAVLPFLTFVQAGRARRRARAIGRHPGAAIDWRGVHDGGANLTAAITGPGGRTPRVSNLSGNPSSSTPASAHQVCPECGRDDSANARRSAMVQLEDRRDLGHGQELLGHGLNLIESNRRSPSRICVE